MTIRRYEKTDPFLLSELVDFGVAVVASQAPWKDVDVGTVDVPELDRKMSGYGWSFLVEDPSQPIVALATQGLASNEQIGDTYVLAASDADGSIRRNSASANTTEIPLNATVFLPVDFVCIITMVGDGLSSIIKEDGVTLDTTKLKLNGKGTGLYVHQVAANVWDVVGGVP